MKWYSILFLMLFFVYSINACELQQDPFVSLTLDEDVKKAYLAPLHNAFNEQFPHYQSTDFEERVKAIEDVSHPLRKKCRYLADAYIVLNFEHDELNAVGMISSRRQLLEVLGFNYNYLLRNTPHILMNHFKILRLQDGELVDLGMLLLGTNDSRIMYEVIKYDLRNDYIEMTQNAYKGIIDE